MCTCITATYKWKLMVFFSIQASVAAFEMIADFKLESRLDSQKFKSFKAFLYIHVNVTIIIRR